MKNSGYRQGYVYVSDRFAGIISETDDGYSFKYDEAYLNSSDAKPVSLTLPLSDEEYISKTLFPFFDGLIPEGWLLDLVYNNWKLNPSDRFAALLCACNDCIGNVSVRKNKL